MKLLSVIILNWNGRKIMEEFLPSVAANTKGEKVELIIADNGSTDDSATWLNANFPSVRLIELDRNYGFAEGYNKAIAQVETPYVILLNSDVYVEEGWWQPMLEFMERHPEAGALQPKILSYRNRNRFEYAGAAGGMLDRLGYPYCQGRVLGKVEEDRGQYDGAPKEITWASGAAMMVRKEAYEKAGGLDEKFFAHMEEIDLCVRMMLRGYKIYFLPDSKVWHLGGGSLHYGDSRKTYLNFRNNLLLLHKNMPKKDGRSFLFMRRLADTLAFGLFLVKGKFGDAKAVIKAHRDFKKLRNEYRDFPKKKHIQNASGCGKMCIFAGSYFSQEKRL